jgi:hypothetical protein
LRIVVIARGEIDPICGNLGSQRTLNCSETL